jgi:hypothetical protein
MGGGMGRAGVAGRFEGLLVGECEVVWIDKVACLCGALFQLSDLEIEAQNCDNFSRDW